MQQHSSVDTYLEQFPSEVRQRLLTIRTLIRSIIPDAEETIKYGIPTYVLSGKNIVHFGGFIRHIGLYPTPPVIEQFTKELQGYVTAKGSIQFPHDKELPVELIRRIVVKRVSQSGEV